MSVTLTDVVGAAPDGDESLAGHSLIAGTVVCGSAGSTAAVDPRTDVALGPEYSLLAVDQLQAVTEAARDAFASFRALQPDVHAGFLDRIADHLEAMRPTIVNRGQLETGLPAARLEGELTRTTGQLRLFAEVVRQGDHLGVRIDEGTTEAGARPDLRQRRIPIGPVVVFGASNFPLAFSTAGGDTASALAAGCPVIVKAHNAHPGTAELAARAIAQAVRDCGLHPGVFSLVYGPGEEVGVALVTDPRVQAVAFTGSRAGGTALMAKAASRPQPIPVFAEMSSVNPVVVLPGRIAGDVAALAEEYVASLTGSSGQLCTAPGLMFVPVGDGGDRFLAEVAGVLTGKVGLTMLTPGIAAAFGSGVERISGQPGVTQIARGSAGEQHNSPAPVVVSTSVSSFLRSSGLQEEVFGAFGLVVRYSGIDDLIAAVDSLEGQLTATLQIGDGDEGAARRLFPHLEVKVGRIIVNGWPTGVDVGHAVVHGGPFPATSDSRTTSVGTAAIERFLRPVAFQNLPESLLPPPVQSANPWGLVRRVNGQVELP